MSGWVATSINFEVFGLTRPGCEPVGSRLEPAIFGFPNLPEREVGALLIRPPRLVSNLDNDAIIKHLLLHRLPYQVNSIEPFTDQTDEARVLTSMVKFILRNLTVCTSNMSLVSNFKSKLLQIKAR